PRRTHTNRIQNIVKGKLFAEESAGRRRTVKEAFAQRHARRLGFRPRLNKVANHHGPGDFYPWGRSNPMSRFALQNLPGFLRAPAMGAAAYARFLCCREAIDEMGNEQTSAHQD